MITHRFGLKVVIAAVVFAASFHAGQAQGQTREASRVRVLIILDTDGYMASFHGFGQDGDNLKKALKEAFRDLNLEDRYTIDILTGKNATPAKVMEHYRTLKTDGSEVLVCYYSGHGGTDKARGHFLALKHGNVYRNDLLKAMADHNPRMLVLLTDCCANFDFAFGSTSTTPTTSDAVKPEVTVKKVELRKPRQNATKPIATGDSVRTLLLHGTGIVDITGSKIGSLSHSLKGKGGHFTLSLLAVLTTSQEDLGLSDGPLTWEGAFVALRTRTQNSAKADSNKLQTPIAFSLGTPVNKSSSPEGTVLAAR